MPPMMANFKVVKVTWTSILIPSQEIWKLRYSIFGSNDQCLYFYSPANEVWQRGILDSACPSVYLFPSVVVIMSTHVLRNGYTDISEIWTSITHILKLCFSGWLIFHHFKCIYLFLDQNRENTLFFKTRNLKMRCSWK